MATNVKKRIFIVIGIIIAIVVIWHSVSGWPFTVEKIRQSGAAAGETNTCITQVPPAQNQNSQ